jgi:hypothetical protein
MNQDALPGSYGVSLVLTHRRLSNPATPFPPLS